VSGTLPLGLSQADGDRLTYSYRPKVMGRPQRFTLTDKGLEADDGHRVVSLAFGAIRRVRLSYRPSNFLTPRFVCEIAGQNGERFRLSNVTWAGLAGLEVQNAAFSTFVTRLHQALGRLGKDVAYERGDPLWRYGLLLALSALPLCALVVIGIMAVQDGLRGTAVAVAMFLAVLLWPTVLHARLNKPGPYRPDALPQALLPK
jgi:hypothetical protein